jgi:CHAT domain-containing protein
MATNDHFSLFLKEEPPAKLQCIWWCATGPLAFLPIHAAGIYATSVTKPGPILSDFAISSYIPNVRVLSERVFNSSRLLNKREKKETAFFMISQPETPKLPRIPGTTKEVLAIKQLLKNHSVQFLSLEGEVATVNQGITYMETHSCVHFACHAHQDTQEPLKSRFMLHDGGLELSEIIKMKLEGADLAYLSACQTSTGDEKLSEEAVHLAAGMLAAGYRGVVATMWSISDQYGQQVAQDFYAGLISQDVEPEQLSTDNAAYALHYSTQKLRRQLGDSVLDWIPYVHFGL